MLCLNGTLVDAGAARIDPSDRGFTLGDGLFETIAVKSGAPRRLDAHLARLHDGAAMLDLPLPWTDAQLAQWIAATASANALADAVVRLTVSRGPGPRGVLPPPAPTPTLVIAAAPLPDTSAAVALITATRTRRNQHSPLARIKSLNYLDNVIARAEAAAAGADDALILNTDGRVAETSIANIFALIGGRLVTPPVADGALPGVMRAEVMRLARAAERSLAADDLRAASEVFLTSALGLRAVVALDGQAIGDGAPGLITQLLATRV